MLTINVSMKIFYKEKKFWENVGLYKIIGLPINDCWNWIEDKNNGYGVFYIRRSKEGRLGQVNYMFVINVTILVV